MQMFWKAIFCIQLNYFTNVTFMKGYRSLSLPEYSVLLTNSGFPSSGFEPVGFCSILSRFVVMTHYMASIKYEALIGPSLIAHSLDDLGIVSRVFSLLYATYREQKGNRFGTKLSCRLRWVPIYPTQLCIILSGWGWTKYTCRPPKFFHKKGTHS